MSDLRFTDDPIVPLTADDIPFAGTPTDVKPFESDELRDAKPPASSTNGSSVIVPTLADDPVPPTELPTDCRQVLAQLNEKHAVLREAGKTVVLTEEWDPAIGRKRFTRSTFGDIRNFYHRLIQVGVDKRGEPKFASVGQFWLQHPERRQYDGIVFTPNQETPGCFNLWRGFAVAPQPGDWSLLQAHIHEVVCANDGGLYDFTLAWMADAVQHPERNAEVALALRGPRGTGKGVFARQVGALFGQHYLQVANARHLTGNFNAHLQDAVVLFADEAFWAGDKAGEGVLKMLITEPVIPIERKGRDVVLARNVLHIIIASNNEWVVPAGMDERRFCVLDVDPCRRQDHAYFGAIVRQMDHGGRAAMLDDLLRHDGSRVNLRAAPETEALRQQKVLSLQPHERWLLDKLMAGRWLPEHEHWQQIVAKDALHEDYVRSLQRIGVERRSTETELGMFLNRMIDGLKTDRKPVTFERDHKTVTERKYVWLLPDLATCRLTFDRVTHSRHPWPDL
jgi:hypothetical protein